MGWNEPRNLPQKKKDEKYNEQNGRCSRCNDHVPKKKAQYHHDFGYSQGGPSQPWNISMVDEKCHNELSAEQRGDSYGRYGNYGHDDSKKGDSLVRKFWGKKSRP